MKKSILLLILLFLISMSLITKTVSIYTSSFTPISGNIDLNVESNRKNIFYNIAQSNTLLKKEDGDAPTNMIGDADCFIPLKDKFNLHDGYTFKITIKTSVKDDFSGIGFYVYAYANKESSIVDGMSFILPPLSLRDKLQFIYMDKSYTSLSKDEYLKDDNNSIIFEQEDFWKWNKVKKYTTSFDNVKKKLMEEKNRYDSYEMDFMASVKQKDGKVYVQIALNDYCFGNFSVTLDMLNKTQLDSELCVGLKTFYTYDKYITYKDIEVTNYQELKEWQNQNSSN